MTLSHDVLRRLVNVLMGLIIIQNIIWGNSKYYVTFFGREISLFDGLLTILTIGVVGFLLDRMMGYIELRLRSI